MMTKALGSTLFGESAMASAVYIDALESVVSKLSDRFGRGEDCSEKGFRPIPCPEAVANIVEQTRSVLFPRQVARADKEVPSIDTRVEQGTRGLFALVSRQISLAFKHDCPGYADPCTRCVERGHEVAMHFLEGLPELREILAGDVQAALDGDPAANGWDEVVTSYPGVFAITVHRLAHRLHELGVLLLPRMMTEHAHARTGIDIHPGAKIGEQFFIDHGTGVVVGETAEIGNRVRIYQGVTLGALSIPRNAGECLKGRKRHPTIQDDVILYSNATILGGETVIGARSIIGGNIWLTSSVPPDTRVVLKEPDLVYIGKAT